MASLLRVIAGEFLKLRHSAALRMVWLLPVLFLLGELIVFERSLWGVAFLPADFLANTYGFVPLKVTGALWGGFFYPLAVAIAAGLLFRPEHRFHMWRHLQVQPVPRRDFFLAKALLAFLLCAAMLVFIWLGLWGIRIVSGWINPILAVPFQGLALARVLAWLWLGSLPVLGFYLWISDRISSLAVPVVFGLVGLLLTVAMGAQENPKPWRRDLIPWVTPYFSAQRVVIEVTGKQESNAASRVFQDEPDVLRLPSGKRIKTWQNVPDEVIFPPPPPTPRWIFLTFSLVGGAVILVLATLDSRRNRT